MYDSSWLTPTGATEKRGRYGYTQCACRCGVVLASAMLAVDFLSERWNTGNTPRRHTLIRDNERATIIESVADLIMMTAKHEPNPNDEAACLMSDIDLAILGSAPSRFAEYDRQIRHEYDWAPADEFTRGRAALFSSMLARDRIYRTEFFHQEFESSARRNLEYAVRREEDPKP
jgi:hypothetical protein